MSLIVGIKEKGYVYMGADTQTTIGDYKYNSLQQERIKIQKFHNGLVIGTVGNVHSIMHTRFSSLISELNTEDLTKQQVVEEIVNPLYLEHEKEGLLEKKEDKYVFGLEMLIAKKNRLFHMRQDGFVVEIESHSAIGAGETRTFSILRYSKDDPNSKIIQCLQLVSDFESGVSEPFILYDTLTDSYRMVEEGEINEINFG